MLRIAVNGLEVEFNTKRKRNSEVVRNIQESGFTECRKEVRDNRCTNLQRCVVLDLGVAIVNFVENVAAVAELEFEKFEARGS